MKTYTSTGKGKLVLLSASHGALLNRVPLPSFALISFKLKINVHFTLTWQTLVCISVCTVADDLPTSDETGPVAEGVCSIGILMCVLCVNVFTVVEEL